MGQRTSRAVATGIAVTALTMLALAPAAHAVNIIESQAPGGKAETAAAGWQAGTCSVDPCSAETPTRSLPAKATMVPN